MSVQLAEREGEAVAARLGFSHLPVDPFLVAEKRNIAVAERDLSGCMGCLMKSGDAFGILYGSGLGNEGVVRFTVAHELGHYFLDGHAALLFPAGDGQHFSQSGFVSNEAHEKEADAFAVGLLMPAAQFRQELREAGSGFAAIQKLAAMCRTSLTATAIRYATYAEDPVAVVLSSGSKVDFCFMSDSLKGSRRFDWLKKGALVPPGTTTARFNRDSENVRLGRDSQGYTDLATWFDGAPEIEVMEDVVGLGRYGRTLTVLFTEDSLDGDEWDASDGDE